MNSELIHLYEQEAVDETGAVVTLRWAEAGYNHPTAPGYYEARIIEAPDFTRSIHAEGSFGGRSDIAYGVVKLLNGDGALDHVTGLALDGRPFRLLLVDIRQPYDTAVVVLSGIAHSAIEAGDNGDELHIYLRDRQEEFDTPLLTRRLGGTNEGGVGIDGDADQEGDVLPRGYGPVRNAEPLLVNSVLDLYCVNDTLFDGGLVVKVGGVPVPPGVQQASPAALADPEAVPAAGTYNWFPGAEDIATGTFTPAYIRFGTRPQKTVTVDFRGTVRAGQYLETAADIIRDIAVWGVRVAAEDIHTPDIAALNALQAAAVGIWIDRDDDAADVVDRVAESVGAWWGFDRLGRFRLQRIEDPAGLAPVLTIRRFGLGAATTPQDGDAISVAWERSEEVGWGAIPCSGVVLSYDHNPTEMDEGDLYGTTGEGEADPVGGPEVRAWLADEWRAVTWPEDTAVSDAITARHRLADVIELEALLRDRATAKAEAVRQFALHSVPRRLAVVSVAVSQGMAAVLDLGVAVRLRLPRFRLDDGQTGLVVKLTYRLRSRTADMVVWL